MSMKMSITSEKQNPFMKRKELMIDIEHGTEATPSKASVEDALVKQISVEKDRIEIIDIVSETGMAKSKSRILVWDEPRPKEVKEEPKKEAAKPEPKKEETKPAEKPKEEKPAEKKEEAKEKPKEEKK